MGCAKIRSICSIVRALEVARHLRRVPDLELAGAQEARQELLRGRGQRNSSSATQSDSLKAYSNLISSGRAKFKLSAYLGGFATQNDFATVTVTWKNAKGKALGHAKVGPVTEAQRRGVTGMLFRSKSGAVPKGAASAFITVRMVRKDGAYIDGYADNLSLTIS